MCTELGKNILMFHFADHQKQRNRFVMLQYWFDGPPVSVQIK